MVYDGEYNENTSFTNGIYTYYALKNFNGWGVKLTDFKSTAPITEAPCVKVNNDYVTKMSSMFNNSSIDNIKGLN